MASPDLNVRISANVADVRRALRELEGNLNDVGRGGDRAGRAASAGLSQINGGASRAIGAIRGLIGAYAGLEGVKAFVRLGDEAKNLDARLKLASRSSEEYARAQAAVFEVAQRTASPLGETVGLYAKLSTATKDLGVSQDRLLVVTEAINQATQLSGTSSESAAAALQQLGQGLSAGTLRGEELNSVLEQAPRLAQALADGLGVGVGELRKLGEAGAITSEQVLNALESQAKTLNGEFKQLPPTVGRAFTQLSNSALQAVGQIDAATGATGGLANVISGLSSFLDSGQLQAGIAEVFGTLGATIGATAEEVGDLIDLIASALPKGAGSGVGAVIDAFKFLPTNIRTLIQVTVTEFAALFDRILSRARGFKEAVTAVFTDDTVADALAREEARQVAIDEARRDSLQTIFDERQAAISAGQAKAAAIEKEIAARKKLAASPGPAAPAGSRRAAAGPQGTVDQVALARDAARRELQVLEKTYGEALISASDYYARRREIQLRDLDLEIKAQQNALAKLKSDDADGRGKILTQIAILGRNRQDILRENEDAELEALGKLGEERLALQAQQLAAEGNAVAAKRLELELQYADQIKRLQAQGDSAGVDIIKSLINTEVAREQFAEIERQAQALQDQLARTQERNTQRVQTGEITGPVANGLNQLAAQETAAKLVPLQQQLATIAATIKDPALAQSAQALGDTIGDLGAKQASGAALAVQQLSANLDDLNRTFVASLAGGLTDGLTNLFTSLAEGSKSAGEAIRDFVRGFIQSLIQLLARAVATSIALQALQFIPGGAAVLSTLDAGSRVGIFHSGGIVGSGGQSRVVDPLLFAGAPRYHDGGIAGLRPGEVPAILQTGEEVLSRSDPRNSMNGGGAAPAGGEGGGNQAGSGFRIVNVLDPAMVTEALSSAQGEKAILNVITRNSRGINQTLRG